MKNCSYGKEPFDLRLTVLRLLRNLDILLVATLVGTLLFGGGYYVKNVMLRGEKTYAVTSTYKVEYVVDPNEVGAYYINEMSWNTFVDSKEFIDAVQLHLGEIANGAGVVSQFTAEMLPGGSLQFTNEELENMISATLASDLRVPATTVTANNSNMAVVIAEAVEMAMVNEFVENTKEIISIKVIDPALEASEVIPDVRPVRAFILSAVLSVFFTLLVLLLREIGDDSIWLPATLRKRYGLASVGTIHSKEFQVNMEYLFADKAKCAVCCADDEIDPNEVIATILNIPANVKEVGCIEGKNNLVESVSSECKDMKWIAAPTPVLCPETCEILRQMDGVLLVVKAGSHVGKPLEYVLECLEQQNCKITAALLWDADEGLINAYYFAQPLDKRLV